MPRKRRKKYPVKRRDDLLDHPRLKGSAKAIKECRDSLLEAQLHMCPLCGLKITQDEAVLDHCHKTGFIRGAIHRGCNAMLGKIENASARMGKMFSDEQFMSMAPSSWYYVNTDYSHMPYHPKHRTAEEKRLSRNERARLSRAKPCERVRKKHDPSVIPA